MPLKMCLFVGSALDNRDHWYIIHVMLKLFELPRRCRGTCLLCRYSSAFARKVTRLAGSTYETAVEEHAVGTITDGPVPARLWRAGPQVAVDTRDAF